MVEQFLHHIHQNKLFDPEDKILLAVSGGIDSSVMLHLFGKAGISAGVAHCNFQLRGAESDADAQFVEDLSARNQMPFFVTSFDTERIAHDRGISIQMAARDLRMVWFEELLRDNKYAYLATAHHLNDVIETVLLNLFKGTGIDGLAGIPVKQQKIVRPLLFASREQIETFAREQNISWREDSSNATDHYQRNKIRNQILPVLREINPGLERTFSDTILRLRASREFARGFLKDFNIRNIYYDGRHVLIRKEELRRQAFAVVILWELVKDLGFNFDQCNEIITTDHQPGVVFTSPTHQITVDRDVFILGKLSVKSGIHVLVPAGTTQVTSEGQSLSFEIVERPLFSLTKDDTIAQLDLDKLTFPLIWRDWTEGDRFIPLGMVEHKKLSDFLIDEKVTLPDKKHVTVIDSGGEIIWVVGKRVAGPVSVTEKTRRVLIVRVDNQN
jgi:tRNA(Ile)-lysidine synthase